MCSSSAAEFRQLFDLAAAAVSNGYKADAVNALSKLFAQKPRTIRRWRQVGKAPAWALQQLVYLARGFPIVGVDGDDSWDGWRFARQLTREPAGTTKTGRTRWRERWRLVLVPPRGRPFTAAEMNDYANRLQLLERLQLERDQVRGWAAERARIRAEISEGIDQLVAAAQGLRQALLTSSWPTMQLELLQAA